MEIYLECEQEETDGLKEYYMLIEDVSKDLGAFNVINSVRVYADLADSLFILALKTRRGSHKIKIRDICKIEKSTSGYEVKISEEKFSPEIASLLSDEFGRESVIQKDRLIIEIKKIEEGDIQNFMNRTFIPAEMQKIEEIIIEFAHRIIPVGFYARKRIQYRDLDVFISGERPITKEDLKKVKKILDRPPEKFKFEKETVEGDEFRYIPYKDELV